MDLLHVPQPVSVGLLLSYKCSIECRDCIYACSPKYRGDWISEEDARTILMQLSAIFNQSLNHKPQTISFNYSLHFTGGEPFLNFDLLLSLTRMAKELNIPFPFVETNCYWCRDDELTRNKLIQLKEAGLDGILISVNPFNIENIPFERMERAARISKDVFGANTIVYQEFYLDLFKKIGLKKTLPFEEFLKIVDPTHLRYIELLPMGRTPYKLGNLYRKYPAEYFFKESCREELTRNWHTHIDNYCNYIPGFCSGISLGDSGNLKSIFCGINLSKKPILKALSAKLYDLYKIASSYGYEINKYGYISKCHLCIDMRKYIIEKTDEFTELSPRTYYLNL
jgi:molybdenum cofactor biosynthesis enzyme MoaA